ncbi:MULTISPECIES: polysaccharide biosynthesis tyrosine autokinase [Corynebacterium]|uniref:polysaccharide biosynthesis tyrosine autokinase n=1 Tax=Corynebacterium TaxID=1716 RepID=UPI001959E8C6|nr:MULTISPECIES: polysaccharide biosynthesis tyrosine autokinase [Corynebacterium]MDN8624951.1 polysaccharide biosynthesis tyrosine autokinase [Corynebacterium kroppenstedtii]QRQ65458.1 polysaccharide biosynthesis tyrosine autokinase [Corynebacterium kroppenstedtii]
MTYPQYSDHVDAYPHPAGVAMPSEEDRTQIVRRMWAVIRRNAWILVLFIVLGVAGAWGVSMLMPTKYTSTASVFVSVDSDGSISDAYQSTQFAEQRMQSYAQLVSGDVLAEQVIQDLNLDMTPRDLTKELEATVVQDTVVMEISATDTDAAQAQKIASDAVKVLSSQAEKLEARNGNGANGNSRSSTSSNQQSATAPRISLINSPEKATQPSSPKMAMNLILGGVLGFLVACMLIAVRFFLDRSVRSSEELERRTGLPKLGSVPVIPEAQRTRVLDFNDDRVRPAEAFRELRVNLRFVNVDNPPRVISVTSARIGDGKSMTSLNLAGALAADGDTVCLVDADMRRSKMTTYFGGAIHGSVGLSTALAGDADVADVLQETEITGLDVLAAGVTPPNPGELLGSHAFRHILDELRERYDWVIVDTPPILPVTDGALVATTVDAVIVAVRYGKRNYDDVTRTLASLRAVHAPIIGTVLTVVPQKSDEGRYVGSYSRYESGSDHKAVASAPASSTVSVDDKDKSEQDTIEQSTVEQDTVEQDESEQEKLDQNEADLSKSEDDTEAAKEDDGKDD